MKKVDLLEELIKDFGKGMKGPIYLNDKTTAKLFATELAKRIRTVASVTKKKETQRLTWN